MIKINNINYVSSDIKQQLKQFQEITLESTNSSVKWEIIKYPNSINNSEFEPKFTFSNDKISTHNPEKIKFDISGNYFIQIVERDLKGNYVRTQLFVEIMDLMNKSSIPMDGETFEFNSLGWAKTVENNLQQLNQKKLAKIIKGVCEEELNLTDLVYINSIQEQNSSGFTFNIDNILNYQETQNVQLGIVVEKIDLTPELLSEKIYVYMVLLNGILNVSEEFIIETDLNNRFYYNVEETKITNDASDSFIGRFFTTERMIIMESEIYLLGTFQDIFSALLINP